MNEAVTKLVKSEMTRLQMNLVDQLESVEWAQERLNTARAQVEKTQTEIALLRESL